MGNYNGGMGGAGGTHGGTGGGGGDGGVWGGAGGSCGYNQKVWARLVLNEGILYWKSANLTILWLYILS